MAAKLSRLRAYFEDVAGIPPPTVWLWGYKASVLAGVAAFVFFVARCLSPLQHLKRLHRLRAKTRGPDDRGQKRRNIEARDTENYFLSALAVSVLIYLSPHLSPGWLALVRQLGGSEALLMTAATVLHVAACVVAGILTVEAFLWISYYLLWRNFAEPVYTLYHPAEYFVLFPVVLLVQSISLAFLCGGHFLKSFVAMVGVDVTSSPLFGVLGQYYFVVIIANLLSMFPSTRFKSAMVVNIIGAGDVVAHRMVPAFLRDQGRLSPRHLLVHTLAPCDSLCDLLVAKGVTVNVFAKDHSETAEDKIIKRVIATGAPVIVASPSDDHFKYVTEFNSAGIRVAVEKPISTLPQEIGVFLDRPELFRTNLFALSYYGLEKALPLTFLLGANHHYVPFLDLDGDIVIDGERSLHFEAAALMALLGPLRSVRIDLIEGMNRSPTAGRRVWTERHGAQGLAFETMIHPLILLQKLLAQQGLGLSAFAPEVTEGSSLKATTAGTVTFLRYDGLVAGRDHAIPVTLTCGKYADKENEKRGGEAFYAGGRIAFNFNQKVCTVTLNDARQTRIFVKPAFQGKYVVQTELMSKFFEFGWKDVRFDDFEHQMIALRWLLETKLHRQHFFVYGEAAGYGPLAAAGSARPRDASHGRQPAPTPWRRIRTFFPWARE